jgi:hypothetical protein
MNSRLSNISFREPDPEGRLDQGLFILEDVEYHNTQSKH